MEEPDVGERGSPPIIFAAVGKDSTVVSTKNQTKRSAGERLRLQKTAPQPILKGTSKKRFSLTPSPKMSQVRKRATFGENPEADGTVSRNKRNLLGDLNKVEGCVDKAGNTQEGEVTILGEVPNEVCVGVSKEPQEKPLGAPTPQEEARGCIGLEIVVAQNMEEAPRETVPLPENDAEPPAQSKGTVGMMAEDKVLGQSGQAGILEVSPLAYHFKKDTKGDGKSREFEKSNGESGWSTAEAPFVSCLDNDLQLDLVVSQPLQTTLPPWHTSQRPLGDPLKLLEDNQPEPNREYEENFPRLNQGIAKSLKAKFEGMHQERNAWAQKNKPLEEKGLNRGQAEKQNSNSLFYVQE